MKKTFNVYATEKVWYQIKVNAETEAEAKEMVADGNYSSFETIDGEDFNILEIAEEV
jgi:hypothetical protein